MNAGAATSESPTLFDQMLVALSTVLYVAGLLVVLTQAGPTGAPSATIVGSVAPQSAAPEGAATELEDPTPLVRHQVQFQLQPGKGVEFKYRLAKGAGMAYVWTATGNVKAEFHGEPDGAKPGYADTYKVAEAQAGRGTFVAPTTGIHGWYWENTGQSPVEVRLESSGFYTAGIEFTAAGPVETPIRP